MRFIGLFSGGRDSLVSCHKANIELGMQEVIYCETGVGLNKEYVIDICKKLGWKLNIIKPFVGFGYEDFIKRYGFPRPTSHTWIMHRLKLNPIKRFYGKEKKKGKPREEIRAPNAENTWDHKKRVLRILNKIKSENSTGTIVIVGHAGTNKVLIGTLQEIDPDEYYKIEQDSGCINIVTINSKNKVLKINDTSHLK